jgi:hypothetical protein
VEDSAIFCVRTTCNSLVPRGTSSRRSWSCVDRSSLGRAWQQACEFTGVTTNVPEQGSSLIEALVATLIVSTGVLTMAQVLSSATVTNLAARRSTVAMILAEQKLEELRSMPWENLLPSYLSTLEQNTDGYVDQVGIYTRRWSIEPVSTSPNTALVFQVLVMGSGQGSDALRVSSRRLRGLARITTVRARSTP